MLTVSKIALFLLPILLSGCTGCITPKEPSTLHLLGRDKIIFEIGETQDVRVSGTNLKAADRIDLVVCSKLAKSYPVKAPNPLLSFTLDFSKEAVCDLHAVAYDGDEEIARTADVPYVVQKEPEASYISVQKVQDRSYVRFNRKAFPAKVDALFVVADGITIGYFDLDDEIVLTSFWLRLKLTPVYPGGTFGDAVYVTIP